MRLSFIVVNIGCNYTLSLSSLSSLLEHNCLHPTWCPSTQRNSGNSQCWCLTPFLALHGQGGVYAGYWTWTWPFLHSSVPLLAQFVPGYVALWPPILGTHKGYGFCKPTRLAYKGWRFEDVLALLHSRSFVKLRHVWVSSVSTKDLSPPGYHIAPFIVVSLWHWRTCRSWSMQWSSSC